MYEAFILQKSMISLHIHWLPNDAQKNNLQTKLS